MIEFLSDYIHELKDLDIKNIDSVYIKELEIKITANLISAKRGESSIVETKNKISAEKFRVMTLLHQIDDAICDDVEDWNDNLEWPTYEHIPEKDIVEKAVFGTVRHVHCEYTGITTKKKITLEEMQKVHALTFYVPILMEYLEFLHAKEKDINNTANDTEYWKMRMEAIKDISKNGNEIITPEQALAYEEQAIGSLLSMQKIIKKPEIKRSISGKEIIIPTEYRINTSVEDVRTALFGLKGKGIIYINDIDLFMKTHLKSKKGKDISSSFRTAKSVKKHKDT